MMSHRYLLATVAVCLAVGPAAANPGKYLLKPAPWFAGDEARQVASNILSFQSALTFNDNAMVRLLGFVREVAIGDGYACTGLGRSDSWRLSTRRGNDVLRQPRSGRKAMGRIRLIDNG